MADPKALEACHPNASLGNAGFDMDAKRIGRVVVVGCFLLLAAWLVRDLYVHAPAKAAATGAAEEATRTAGDTSTRFVPAASNEPLPPEDAPLAQVFDTLKQRADAGDAHAACRLAVKLLQCRNLPTLQALAGGATEEGGHDNEADYSREGNLAAANFFAEAKLRLLEAQERCKDISKEQNAFAARYLHQAARAGISDAIVRYADGQAFDPMAMFGMLRDPAFDAWRREAPELAMQALRQGNPKAAFLLYGAYSSDHSLFAGLVRDDPVQARAFRLLLETLKGAPHRRDDSLAPAQQEAAEALADRMYRDDFHGRPLSDDQRAAFDAAMQSAFSAGTDACQ